MNEKALLFFIAIILCANLQAGQIPSAAPAESNTGHGAQLGEKNENSGMMPDLMDRDCYGSTSSFGDVEPAHEGNNSVNCNEISMSETFSSVILKNIKCFLPCCCCATHASYPDSQSCCCDNSCGRLIFTCCMK
ncbi:MAG: hypothetical protein NTZ68_04405 [Candidatus Dependentiae bacterium]|nr:hypothetical protein [Candidatus Dependentiae bacterium]